MISHNWTALHAWFHLIVLCPYRIKDWPKLLLGADSGCNGGGWGVSQQVWSSMHNHGGQSKRETIYPALLEYLMSI